MKIDVLIFEVRFIELTHALFEKTSDTSDKNNRIVKSWAKKIGVTYDELHAVWEKAQKSVGSETNYFAIVGAFKKMVTSLKWVTKKQLQTGGTSTFDYKVRTRQTMAELMDDKPAHRVR